jgi:poly-gamma-glutamate synthesis protein (capsule biosynthesis protein)
MEAARGGAQVERLALVAVSDHPQEYAAGPQAWGIAWADLRRGVPEWLTGELERARAAGAFVVAFPHWGPNMAVRPARWQRERAADLVRAGAHLVAGHSAHLFHGVERLEPGLVLYDLGDALDDYAVDAHLRNDLGLLALWRPGSERREPELELLGLRGDYCHTRLARGADAEWIARRLEGACRELGTVVERTGEARFTVG